MEDINEFIEQNKNFIYNTCCYVCNRKLNWKNDDELSIGLIAFNKACNTYKGNKGNFFGYSKILIKNALIDYFRKCEKTPYLIFNDKQESIDYIDNRNSMDSFKNNVSNAKISEQIAIFSKELLKYKLKFSSLAENSPSHKDTREKLLNVALECSREDNIVNFIRQKKKLPIKQITLLTSQNRKFLDKWRKYILTLIIILCNSEFTYIRSYLNIKVGDKNE